ncbi:MAG: hypothetical protein IJR68_06485 [Fretibacterium sp.]|nr:hypothetical protein [Oscillibacter sp.]MBQ9527240.1 hypothetical protein [Fretibacterium sp.]
MAWLKIQQEMSKHPKTKRLARMLNIPKAQAIGHLFMFWGWALDYADDGDLSKFDAYEIADAAEWEGDPEAFLNAMIECGPGESAGFIERQDGKLSVHEWDEYMGILLERRKKEAQRLREYRSKKQEQSSCAYRTESVHSTDDVRTSCVLGKSRVEKSREEKNTTPPTPPSQGGGAVAGDGPAKQSVNKAAMAETYSPEFEAFWGIYPRHVEKKPALKAWKAAERQGARADDMLTAAKEYAEAARIRGTPQDKIKHAATFLHENRWKDWLPPDGAAYLETRNAATRGRDSPRRDATRETQPPATWEDAVRQYRERNGLSLGGGENHAKAGLANVS